jgi:hypothetical protein
MTLVALQKFQHNLLMEHLQNHAFHGNGLLQSGRWHQDTRGREQRMLIVMKDIEEK